jgi:hypothetical protein
MHHVYSRMGLGVFSRSVGHLPQRVSWAVTFKKFSKSSSCMKLSAIHPRWVAGDFNTAKCWASGSDR